MTRESEKCAYTLCKKHGSSEPRSRRRESTSCGAFSSRESRGKLFVRSRLASTVVARLMAAHRLQT